MLLQEILNAKGQDVHTIEPEASLDDVVQRLVKFNCGSLLVSRPAEDGQAQAVIGIITERDILRACAARRGPLEEIQVASVMSTNLITGAPNDQIERIMGLMTEHRIRHLPVLKEGCLCGIVSIGDVVKSQHQQMAVENHYMKAYIHGGMESLAENDPSGAS